MIKLYTEVGFKWKDTDEGWSNWEKGASERDCELFSWMMKKVKIKAKGTKEKRKKRKRREERWCRW